MGAVDAGAARRLDVAVWISVLAAAGALGATGDASTTIDTQYFLHASQTLLSTRWLETFADRGLQAGPLQIAGVGLAGRLGAMLGISELRTVDITQSVLLTAMALTGAAALCGPRRRPLIVGAVGAAALGTGMIRSAFFYGHAAEVANPVLWALAGRASMRRRPLIAGFLVGASAGFETWGILGLAVLLVDRRIRAMALSVGMAIAVVAATYGPFVVHGPFAMFEYHWAVMPGTLPAFLGIGASFGWPLRLLQAAVATTAGATAALLYRDVRAAAWIVPMSIVCAKVGLDPERGAWYLLAPQTVALVAAAHVAGSAQVEQMVRGRRTVGEGSGPRLELGSIRDALRPRLKAPRRPADS